MIQVQQVEIRSANWTLFGCFRGLANPKTRQEKPRTRFSTAIFFFWWRDDSRRFFVAWYGAVMKDPRPGEGWGGVIRTDRDLWLHKFMAAADVESWGDLGASCDPFENICFIAEPLEKKGKNV